MWLKDLHLENWMLFQHVDLELDQESKVIGIVGRYLDGDDLDSDRSNRSGKSSLAEAIRFLFYGKGRDRSQIKLINRTGLEAGQGMRVHGTLVMRGGRELRIARGRSAKGEPWVEVQGHEGASWTVANEYLEEVLGFAYKEFVHTCYFGQGDIHQFMSSDPKAKRNLILGWLGQERWEARESYCQQRIHDISVRIEGLKQVLAGIIDIGSVKECGIEVESAEIAYRQAKDVVTKAKADVKKWLTKLDEAKEHTHLLEQKNKLEFALKDASTNLKFSRRDVDIYKAAESQKITLEKKKEEITEQWEIVKGPLIAAKIEAETKGKELAKKLESVERGGGICPVLNEACERIDPKATIKEFVGRLEKLRFEYASCNKKLNIESEKVRLKLAELNDQIANQNEVMVTKKFVDPEIYKSQISRLKKELKVVNESLPKRIVGVSVLQKKYESADEDLLSAQNACELAAQQFERAKVQFERAKEVAQQKKQWEIELAELEEQMAAWRYTKFMFGGRGIPGEHLRSAFVQMEHDINHILDRLGVGIEVVFQPYRVTKTLEPSCLVCGYEFSKGHGKKRCPTCKSDRQHKQQNALVLEITDVLEGQKSEFDLDSGGGQTLISFAVRLALLLLKVREGHDDPPPIILDEVVGNLDAYHRQAIMDLVMNVLPNDYGFQQTWWISHNEEVQSALESRLLVCREGQRSTVEWA